MATSRTLLTLRTRPFYDLPRLTTGRPVTTATEAPLVIRRTQGRGTSFKTALMPPQPPLDSSRLGKHTSQPRLITIIIFITVIVIILVIVILVILTTVILTTVILITVILLIITIIIIIIIITIITIITITIITIIIIITTLRHEMHAGT
jgi:hypothetical protein